MLPFFKHWSPTKTAKRTAESTFCSWAVAVALLFNVAANTAQAENPNPLTLKVELQGLKGQSKDLIKNVEVFTKPPNRRLRPASARRLSRRGEERIEEALRPFGFYTPIVITELALGDDSALVTYKIELGPRTTVEEVDIRIEGIGRDAERIAEAIKKFPMKAGDALDHRRYKSGKAALLDAANRAGYLDAAMSRHELAINPVNAKAWVRLDLQTGPLYRFGKLQVEQSELRPEVIERYIDIVEGEPFDPDRLIDLQILLSDLDYFSSVELDVDRENAENGHLPVLIRTTPRARQKYVFGVGYGTDTGPRTRVGAEWRRLNSLGHRLRTEIRVAEIKRSATGVYEIPIGRRAGQSLALSGEFVEEDIGDGQTQETVIGLSRNKRHKGWLRRIFINLEREDFELGVTRETSNLVIPGISYSRSVTTDPLFTRKGWSAVLELRGAHEAVFSTTSFSRFRGEFRLIRPIGKDLRLLSRLEVGALISENFADLPPTQRFFAGGDRSVRGYGFQSLGPTDASGEVIGGRYLAVGSLEVDWLFWDNIGAAVFYDIGNAADDPAENLNRGAGFGFRWRSPVGMLRLDLAHPFDNDDEDLRVHVGIGAEL